MKKVSYAIAVIGLIVGGFYATRFVWFASVNNQEVYEEEDGTQLVARVQKKEFQIYTSNGEWKEMFVTGVDLGAGKPGYFPGDNAITKEEYLEWFQQIAEMNARVIRNYIPQMPSFYEAFYEYNQAAEEPLYLVQGVYVNEQGLEENKNLAAEETKVMKEFRQDIQDAIHMIHGDGVVQKKTGKAYGQYARDISSYVIGLILGIEFDAETVSITNKENQGVGQYEGSYVKTEKASPFEYYLAQIADYAVEYEMKEYQMQRPVALCNWPTTDPLSHPNEPYKEKEDSEVIDVEHILAKETFSAGFFASYHVYPYYPEFIMHDQKYQVEGSNSYKEYLRELNEYHSMPILISEFGVPSARGIAHANEDTGFNQGHMTEEEQGKAIASMIADIYDTGCMGGIIFTWQDEWFKRTWNTMNYDNSTRRPYWHNVQTAEQNFGLLAYEPTNSVVIDGQDKEWKSTDVLIEEGNLQLSVKQDCAYLYLKLSGVVFDRQSYCIPFDIILGQGLDSYENTKFQNAADFVLILSGKEDSKLLVDAEYNMKYREYNQTELMNEYRGFFVSITQVISGVLEFPETMEVTPFSEWETGRLKYGSMNKESSEYTSLTDFSEKDGIVEIRIPWMLLNFADPSQKEIITDLSADGENKTEKIDQIEIGFGELNQKEKILMNSYSLEPWDKISYTTRLKDSYPIVKKAFNTYYNNTEYRTEDARNKLQRRLAIIQFETKWYTSTNAVFLCFVTLLYFIGWFLRHRENRR